MDVYGLSIVGGRLLEKGDEKQNTFEAYKRVLDKSP